MTDLCGDAYKEPRVTTLYLNVPGEPRWKEHSVYVWKRGHYRPAGSFRVTYHGLEELWATS